LVDVADYRFNRGETAVGLSCRLLGHLSFVAGVYSVLVGFVGLGRGQLDALLGAAIHILNHPGVAGGEFVEFIHAVADGLGLALYILLAGKRINFAPETFASFCLQRLFAGGADSLRGGGSGLVCARWSRRRCLGSRHGLTGGRLVL
jgi:hypothetical protein